MGKFLIFAILVSFILLVPLPNDALSSYSHDSSSFTIRLIHKYDPESPFYPGNLTFLERMERTVNDSLARVSHLKSIISLNGGTNYTPQLVRPYVSGSGLGYVAEVRVGDSGRYFYFLLDTAADMSWVLCKWDTHFSFFKEPEYFNPYLSTNYREINCNARVCKGQCIEGKCIYRVRYGDGEISEGVYSRDRFTFKSPTEPSQFFSNILFVCADPEKTHAMPMGDITAKGLLALGPSPESLTSQLGQYIRGRFSYCLVPPKKGIMTPMSYLKFGMDMGYKSPQLQSTKFLKVRGREHFYYLHLQDISVNGKRFNYQRVTFLINKDHNEGFIIDTGSGLSFLHGPNYWKLHYVLLNYFAQFHLVRRKTCPYGGKDGIQLCYELPDNFTSLPSMTYHFKDANLEVEPEQVFMVDRSRKILALAIAIEHGINVLGAYQQHNTRFTYDNTVGENSLSFISENCKRDPLF
ncbi:hypothetical protein ACFE04_005618 [Oxalis oulophora]